MVMACFSGIIERKHRGGGIRGFLDPHIPCGLHHVDDCHLPGSRRVHSPGLGRVIAWWLSSALCALLVWSTWLCRAAVRSRNRSRRGRERGRLRRWVRLWAGFAIGAVLPFYGLLLTWYTIRFGREPGGWSTVTRNVAFLGLPPATVAVRYGRRHNGEPALLHAPHLCSALSPPLRCWPRKLSRRLGPVPPSCG